MRMPRLTASLPTAASAAGLPSADASGLVSMTLHQVNQDGAGYAPLRLAAPCLSLSIRRPYTCDVSTDATGNDFQAMTVVTNVPGVFSLSGATAEDFPLVARASS